MKYLVVVGIALIVIYEIYAVKSTASGDTISEVVWKLSKRPMVPFLFGVLCGHFFWQSSRLD
jgi:hypothetical protein